MLDPRLVFLAGAFSLLGSLAYARSTVQGRTRPNRVSWFLWALAPAIGFLAQLDEGVGLPAVLTLSIGLGPAIILASSFVNPASYWRVSRFDLACGLVSVAALVVWLGLDSPGLAVLVAVLADAVGGIPTMVKTWRVPESEDPVVFLGALLNGGITLLTIQDWTPSAWAFPAYIGALGAVLGTVWLVRSRPRHGEGDAAVA